MTGSNGGDKGRKSGGPVLSASELEEVLARTLPAVDHHGEVVEKVGDGLIRLRLPYQAVFSAPVTINGITASAYSGPLVMGFADTAMYACIMADQGRGAVPFMISYTIGFLNAAKPVDLIAEARIVRRGRRMFYVECWLTSDGDAEPSAHITSTYQVMRA